MLGNVMLRSGKFLFIALVVVSVGLVLAAWRIQNHLKNDTLNELEQSLKTILETTHQAIESWNKEQQTVVSLWSNIPKLRQAAIGLIARPQTTEALLSSSEQRTLRKWLQPLSADRGYHGYFIVARNNLNLASSRDENVGTTSLLTQQPEFLQSLWSGQSAVSLPFVSDVALPDSAGKLRLGMPTMFVGAPIRNAAGQVVAILTLRLDPAEEFSHIFTHGQFGLSGETYAFDKLGRLISESRFDAQLQQVGLLAPFQRSILNIEIRDPGKNLLESSQTATLHDGLAFTQMAISAMKGESGSDLQGYRDYRGVPVVGAWLWDDAFGFGIATEVDVKQAHRTIHTTKNVILALTLLIIFLQVGLVLLFNANLSRKRAENALRKARKGLEIRVEKRTTELATVNEELRVEINERKQAEEYLRQERDRAQQYLDTVEAIIIALNTQGEITLVNRKGSEILGYSEEDLLGKNWFTTCLPQPEGADIVLEVFQSIMKGHLKQTEYVESTVVTRAGDKRLIAWHNSYAKDQNGQISGSLSSGEDITEIKLAKERAEQHQAELMHMARLNTMGEMATGIAHEINQPLTAVANYASVCQQILHSIENAPKTFSEALEGIQSQTMRAAEIIRRLRDFVRKKGPEMSYVNLNNLVNDVVGFILADANKYGIELKLHLDKNLPLVYADRIQIEQVLLNLARNSMEAMDMAECKTCELTIRTFVNNEDIVQADVIDTGPGMEADILNHIFDPFYSTKEGAGMGMGLSISRSIMEAHGGRLAAESTVAQGSTFCFTLPLTQTKSQL